MLHMTRGYARCINMFSFQSKKICIPRAYVKHTCKPPFHLGLENIQPPDVPKQNSHLSPLHFKSPFLPPGPNPALFHTPNSKDYDHRTFLHHFSYTINVAFQDDVTASASLSASYHIHMALPPAVYDSCSMKSPWLPTQTMWKWVP